MCESTWNLSGWHKVKLKKCCSNTVGKTFSDQNWVAVEVCSFRGGSAKNVHVQRSWRNKNVQSLLNSPTTESCPDEGQLYLSEILIFLGCNVERWSSTFLHLESQSSNGLTGVKTRLLNSWPREGQGSSGSMPHWGSSLKSLPKRNHLYRMTSLLLPVCLHAKRDKGIWCFCTLATDPEQKRIGKNYTGLQPSRWGSWLS